MEFGSILAMVDLTNTGCDSNISKLQRDSENTNTYIFNDDGDTLKIVDRYDEPLKETTLSGAIEALLMDCDQEDYRRFHSALAVLRAFNNVSYNNVVVLFYGH